MDSENTNGLLVALGLGRFNSWGDFEYGEVSDSDADFVEEFWDTDAVISDRKNRRNGEEPHHG